jgi:hypothetical protein
MRLPSKSVWVIILAAILGGIWAIDIAWAQKQNHTIFDEVPIDGPSDIDTPQNSYSIPPAGRTIDDKVVMSSLGSSIRQAAEAIRDAKDDKAKATAGRKLGDILSKYFDEDMARRESELTKIEERLIKLRDLHNRRRVKKQEIIELQTKVALNEAEGLGFYDGQSQNHWQTGFDSPAANPFAPAVTGRTYPNEPENIPTPSQNLPSTGAVIIPDLAQPTEPESK